MDLKEALNSFKGLYYGKLATDSVRGASLLERDWVKINANLHLYYIAYDAGDVTVYNQCLDAILDILGDYNLIVDLPVSLGGGTGYNVQETSITSAELLSGVTKTVLDAPTSGYAHNILNVCFSYHYGTSAYTGGDHIFLYTVLGGIDYLVKSINRSSIIANNSTYGEAQTTGSPFGADMDSGLSAIIPSFSSGNGTLKIFVYYITQPL
jgi:hypothetical protein